MGLGRCGGVGALPHSTCALRTSLGSRTSRSDGRKAPWPDRTETVIDFAQSMSTGPSPSHLPSRSVYAGVPPWSHSRDEVTHRDLPHAAPHSSEFQSPEHYSTEAAPQAIWPNSYVNNGDAGLGSIAWTVVCLKVPPSPRYVSSPPERGRTAPTGARVSC
jgi:hypothetical protein